MSQKAFFTGEAFFRARARSFFTGEAFFRARARCEQRAHAGASKISYRIFYVAPPRRDLTRPPAPRPSVRPAEGFETPSQLSCVGKPTRRPTHIARCNCFAFFHPRPSPAPLLPQETPKLDETSRMRVKLHETRSALSRKGSREEKTRALGKPGECSASTPTPPPALISPPPVPYL